MEAQTGTVKARDRSNRVADLEPGITYEIEVAPGATWKDAFIEAGPQGYTAWWLKPFERLRRHPESPWFALIGAVEDGEHFLIGRGTVVPTRSGGELRCYANDVDFMYWNNSGSIDVVVTAQED